MCRSETLKIIGKRTRNERERETLGSMALNAKWKIIETSRNSKAISTHLLPASTKARKASGSEASCSDKPVMLTSPLASSSNLQRVRLFSKS